jgi:hypothetical protein
MGGEGERLLGVGRHASSPPLLFIEPFAAFAPSPRSVEAGDAAMLWLFCFFTFFNHSCCPCDFGARLDWESGGDSRRGNG